jgi:uncharacterized protein (DUF1778 family)
VLYGALPYTEAKQEEAVGARAERLEARITAEQKELFKEAAAARGVSLTDFVVNSVHEAAVRTLQARQTIELGREDQRVFVEALLQPSAPNKALRDAVRRQGYSSRSRRRSRT